MRAFQVLIGIAALLALVGVAAAQNGPCPECDPDGDGVYDNPYHSIDVGAIVENETQVTDEVLADTDVAYANEGDDKGFWLWLALCLSAFSQHVEDLLGIHTDVDANVEVYAESNGVDIDASTSGVQSLCESLEVGTDCPEDVNFDRSELGDLDGATWETIATVEATLGEDIEVPAVVPDTGSSDTDVCVHVDLVVCG